MIIWSKNVLFIVLMLIILMASLNIISSLLMVVMNRRKEIALLLSLRGCSAAEVCKSFFLLGDTIGLGWIVFGVMVKWLRFLLRYFSIITLPADVYGVSKCPLCATGGVYCVLFIVYPAKKAAQIDALSVLRNE